MIRPRTHAVAQRHAEAAGFASSIPTAVRDVRRHDRPSTREDVLLPLVARPYGSWFGAETPPAPAAFGGPNVPYLQFLQRRAGNSAVGAWLSQAAGAPAGHRPHPVARLYVQSCGPIPCDCPEKRAEPEEKTEERRGQPVQAQQLATGVAPSSLPTDTRDGAATVQRGLADVAAAVLPSWVTDLVTGTPKEAHDLAGKVTSKGDSSVSDAKTQANQAGQESSAGAESVTKQGEQQSGAQAREAAAETGGAEKSASASAAGALAPATRLAGAATAATGLINPLGPMVELPAFHGAVDHVSSVVSAIPGGVADLASDIEKSVTGGLKEGQTEGWDCDQSEIMAMVGGVKRAVAEAAVKAGKKVLGEGRYEALSTWVHARMADVKTVAAGVKKAVGNIETKAKKWWDTNVGPLIPKVRKLQERLKGMGEDLKKWVSGGIKTRIENIHKAWTRIKTSYIDPAVTYAQDAKQTATRMYNTAKARIGTWWSHLPRGLQTAIMGIGAIIAGPAGLVAIAAEKAGTYLAGHKKGLLSGLQKMADGFFKGTATAYKLVKAQAKKVIKAIKGRGHDLVVNIKTGARKIYGAIDGAVDHRISLGLTALETLRKKITGQVCTALGEVAGPCIEQFVPDPGKNAKEGESSDVTLTTSGELTVPVYEVPVKVGEGASAKLSRQGKAYTLTLEGNGLLAVATPTEGSSTEVNVQGFGQVGQGSVIWQAITGRGGAAPSPAAAAPTAAAPTASGGGGGPASAGQTPAGSKSAGGTGGGSAQAEAGIKCSVSMSFGFDAGKDSTCDGLGGLTALLANCGLSSALPPPFSSMVGAATQAAYAQNVTACNVKLSEYGKAEVDLLKSGLGGVKAAINKETSIETSHALVDPTDKSKGWQDTATLTDTLGESIAGQILMGGDEPLNPKGVGGTAGLSSNLYVTLVYSEKLDKISAASAGAKMSFTLELNRGQVMSTLPDRIAQQVLPQIDPLIQGASKGVLTVTAQTSLENLQDLARELDAYFDNPAAVDSAGVVKIVAGHFLTSGNIKKAVTVSATVTDTIGKVELSEKDKEVSGKASVGLEKHQTKVLYP